MIALLAALVLSQAPPARGEPPLAGDAPPPGRAPAKADGKRAEDPPPGRARVRRRAPDADAPVVDDLELLKELEVLELLDALDDGGERPRGRHQASGVRPRAGFRSST